MPTQKGRASATLIAAAVPGNAKLRVKSCGMVANASVPVIGGMGQPVDVVVPLGWFELEQAVAFHVGAGDGEARYTVEREEEKHIGRVDYTLPPNNFPYPRLSLYSVQEAPGFVHRFEIDLLGNKCRLNAQVLTADGTGESMAFIICPTINFEGWRTVGTPLTSAAWTKGGNHDRHVDFPIRFVRLSALQWLQNQAGSGTLKFANPRFHCTVAESQSVWAEIGSPTQVKMAELPDAGVPVPVRVVNLTDVERKLAVLVSLCKEDGPEQVLRDETLALRGKEARILHMSYGPSEPGSYKLVATVLGEIIDVKAERWLRVTGADEAP